MGKDGFSLSYRGTAIGAVMVAVGCVVALAIVAKVQNADSLSVIALAMAIIALLVQLGVMAYDINSSKASEIRAEQIFAQTTEALARIEGRTTEARDLVREQLVPALKAGLSELPQVAEDVAKGGDSTAGAQILLESITNSIDAARDEAELIELGKRRIDELLELKLFDPGRTEKRKKPAPPKVTNGHKLGLVVGDRVNHPTFGDGEIKRIDGKGDKAVAHVWFPRQGTKQLLLEWAPLTRVDPEGQDD